MPIRTCPAVEVRRVAEADLAIAEADDFGPLAAEERGDGIRLFFASPASRDRACARLQTAGYDAHPIDVDDEDWGRRSQEGLGPVTVGGITVVSPPAARDASAATDSGEEGPLVLVIAPSMGFGTGHHATTRLCLAALQDIDVTGRFVLDIGTGSGVLAIAAARLGAAHVVGIDHDPDAVQAARENLALNPAAVGVELRVADLASAPLPEADVILANLTGALLVHAAPRLLGALSSGGTLVVSGLLAEEREAVRQAFASARVVWNRSEDGWVGLAFRIPRAGRTVPMTRT